MTYNLICNCICIIRTLNSCTNSQADVLLQDHSWSMNLSMPFKTLWYLPGNEVTYICLSRDNGTCSEAICQLSSVPDGLVLFVLTRKNCYSNHDQGSVNTGFFLKSKDGCFSECLE